MTIHAKQANASNYKAASRTAADIGYIVIHYTGNRGDTAKNNADFFASGKVSPSRSAHYFVDENEAWQSVRDKDVAWQMSAKKYYSNARNANSIGIEICMLDKAGNIRQGSIDHAAQLVRELMTRYGITTGRVLRHYDVTRKSCPAPMVEDAKRWAAFKAALTAPEPVEEDKEMYTIFKTIKDVPDWGRECVNDLIAKGYLKGDGDGQFDLEHYMLRTLVIGWRAGVYK